MSMRRSLLIIEHDDAVRQALMNHLNAQDGFDSVGVTTLTEASRHFGTAEVRLDAVVLEATLPDGDGRDFCAQMRQQGHKMPVLILTNAFTEADVVRGMDSGANDYISKPLRVNELMARLRAHLRTFDNGEDAVFTIGAYTFRPAAKLLAKQGEGRHIRLTQMEAGILKFLYRTDKRVVPHQTLLDEVWGYAGASRRTLETHIYRLRRKLEVDPTDCRHLLTMPGGYQLDLAGQTNPTLAN